MPRAGLRARVKTVQPSITGFATTKSRARNNAKRLKTSNVPDRTHISEADSGHSSTYHHKLPDRQGTGFTTPQKNPALLQRARDLDVDQTSVDGYQVLTPPSTPCSQRARTVSENSTSSVATNFSSASTKENKPPGFATPNKRPIGAISSSTATITPHAAFEPLTPLKASVKRRRRSGEEERSYDFSQSPKTAAEGIKALAPLLKRNKCSSSPRVPKSPGTPTAEAPGDDVPVARFIEKSTPIENPATPAAAPEKKLTVAQRIAALKAKKLETIARQDAAAAKATPRAEAPSTSIETPKASTTKSKIAEMRSKLAARKAETQKSKDVNESARQRVGKVLERLSPILRISDRSRQYIRESYKEINVEEKLRTLELPQLYKIARSQFKHIDQSVQVLHNRRQTILANRVLRDAGKIYREYNFNSASLQTVSGIKDDAYQFLWKRGLRTEDSINMLETSRIKSDNFQLTMKPTNLEDHKTGAAPKTPALGNHVQMTVGHIQGRFKDFSRRLLVAVYEKHREFRAKAKGISEEQEEREFPLSEMRYWHSQFPVQTAVRDLKEFSYELPPKPLGVGATPNNPTTPLSGRRLLQSLNKQCLTQNPIAAATPPADSAQPVAARPAYLDSPEYRSLPKSLQAKYEERMRRTAEKAMVKEKVHAQNELEELKGLYDVARGLKSYYTVKQTLSGNIETIASQISKSSKTLVTSTTTKQKLLQLANLSAVKDAKLFEVIAMGESRYVRMKSTTKLQDIKDAIDLAIQRKTQALGL